MINLTRNTIILTLLFIVLLKSNIVIADASNWQVEIELSKTTYMDREPIWLDVTVKNISSDTIRVLGLFPPAQPTGVGITLKDSLGNKMPYTGAVYHFGARHGFVLNPNEQFYDCFDLLELFSTYRNLLGIHFGQLPTGNYSVEARYRGAVSQELMFNVGEPTGQEETALQLLMDGFALWPKKEFEQADLIFESIVNRYPNSVYAEKAFRELYRREEFLQRYPNSGYCQIYLKGLTRQLEKNEKTELCLQAIQQHPGTRVAKFADKMLQLMEK